MELSGVFIIIILLGAVQGFIISGLLLFSKIKRLSGRLLGILIFLISLASLNIYLNNQPWFAHNSSLQIFHSLVPWVMVMPVGPLIYFYIKSFLEPDTRLSHKDKLHFYPVVLDIVPQILVLSYFIARAFGPGRNAGPAIVDFIDNYNVYVDILRWLSVSYYILLSYTYLANFYKKNSVEATGKMASYKWLMQFIRFFMAFQVIWLLYLVPYIIPATRFKLLDAVDWYPVYVPLAILIYVLGIEGYLQLYHRIPSGNKEVKPAILPESLVTSAIADLHNSMERDKLYLDQALNLGVLAKHTGIAPKTISTILNQHLHKSFNEFVNEYRVREIKSRLLEPQSKNLTIAGVAYECGFNSLPTFQRAFKSVVGLSPTEFITKERKSV